MKPSRNTLLVCLVLVLGGAVFAGWMIGWAKLDIERNKFERELKRSDELHRKLMDIDVKRR